MKAGAPVYTTPNPSLVLGLATGRTMEALYAELVRMHREEGLDFSLCRTFNLDEYVGLFPSDPNSYRHYMNHHLFRHVNVDLRNTHLPNGMAEDLDQERLRGPDHGERRVRGRGRVPVPDPDRVDGIQRVRPGAGEDGRPRPARQPNSPRN